MTPLTTSQRNKLIYTGLATLAALLLIYLMIMSPLFSARKGYRTQIADANDKIEKANRLIRKTDDYKRELAEFQAQLETIEAGMASGGDLYYWITRTVNNFRMTYRVEIPTYTTVSMGEVGLLPNFPYPAAFCTIKGSAFYHELGKFLADFENAFPYIHIKNLALRPEGATTSGLINAEDQEKLNFEMEIVVLIAKAAKVH